MQNLTILASAVPEISSGVSKVKVGHVTLTMDLPTWPSGKRTKPPLCAVGRDALSGRGSRLSPGASAYQRIISTNSYAHDEQGVNPGQVRVFYGVLYVL